MCPCIIEGILTAYIVAVSPLAGAAASLREIYLFLSQAFIKQTVCLNIAFLYLALSSVFIIASGHLSSEQVLQPVGGLCVKLSLRIGGRGEREREREKGTWHAANSLLWKGNLY